MRQPVSLAESVFCEHFAGRSAGRRDIESLCAEHPELAQALRNCHARHQKAVQVLHVAANPHQLSAPARYQIVREIGRGGMGSVVEAHDSLLGRTVAMKMPRAGAADGLLGLVLRERARCRLVGEAQILAQLHHPGMVPVHDVGTDGEGRPFFTMLLVEGQGFGAVIEAVHRGDRAWPLTRAVDALQRVCTAIAFAHAHGVVHRDLKPENLMLGEEGQVYVLDWGLAFERASGADLAGTLGAADGSAAAAHDGRGAPVAAAGEIVGTPAYMAPEQAAGTAPGDDPRVDVYGVGAILYHLLCGARPYAELGEAEPLALIAAVRRAPPRPLAAAARRMPEALIAIAAKAMARDPAHRYATMQALAVELRAFLDVRPVAAHRSGAWPELRLWLARNRGAAATFAVAMMVAVAALLTIARTQDAAAATVRQAGERQRAATSTAEEEARIANARAADVLLPADRKHLDDLLIRHRQLGVADRDNAAVIAAWIGAAELLLQRRPLHVAALDTLRSRALDAAGARAEADRRATQRAALAVAQRTRNAAFEELQRAPGDRVAQAAAVVAAEHVESQRAAVGTAPVWRFDSPQEQWQHDALAHLVESLDVLVPVVARERERLSFASGVCDRSLTGPVARAAWIAAIAEIADPRACPAYGGLRVEPQLGLLPIGRDPRSGLYEFAHLETGEPAVRDPATGALRLSEATGIVLVLLPGGATSVGSQSDDPTGAYHDPLLPQGQRLRRIRLQPSFLAKYEMTQAQWLRVTGSNPSYLAPARNHEFAQPITLLHPVGMLSFDDAEQVLHRLALRMPSVDEWEYGARAGTTTMYWTGDRPETLAGAANVADVSAKRGAAVSADAYAPAVRAWTAFDDGFANTSPIGSLAPNAFGLHDVHGNITEWARSDAADSPGRLCGGGALYPPGHARSAFQFVQPADYRWTTFGVRPARSVDGGVHGAR
jgi:serine/threonine protein kinase/formylglycine-generating enzyme required for sulfatase activity